MTRAVHFAGHLGLRGPDRPLLAHSARSTDPLDQIDALAENGFTGVQDLFLKLRPPAEQAAIGRRLKERTMRLTSFGGDPLHWNKPLWNRDDAESRALLQASVDGSIAAEHLAGGGGAVCVTGVDPKQSRAAQVAAMIENLKHFADIAARGNLTLLVEPVAAQWIPGLLVDSLEDGAAIVRAVDNPSVRLLFDIGHVWMMGHDILPALDAHWDSIGAIQAADMPGRVDLGAGELDWVAILAGIAARGHAMPIEIEHEPQDASVEGETRLIERLRRIEKAVSAGLP